MYICLHTVHSDSHPVHTVHHVTSSCESCVPSQPTGCKNDVHDFQHDVQDDTRQITKKIERKENRDLSFSAGYNQTCTMFKTIDLKHLWTGWIIKFHHVLFRLLLKIKVYSYSLHYTIPTLLHTIHMNNLNWYKVKCIFQRARISKQKTWNYLELVITLVNFISHSDTQYLFYLIDINKKHIDISCYIPVSINTNSERQ